jgi:hypothetical protein
LGACWISLAGVAGLAGPVEVPVARGMQVPAAFLAAADAFKRSGLLDGMAVASTRAWL